MGRDGCNRGGPAPELFDSGAQVDGQRGTVTDAHSASGRRLPLSSEGVVPPVATSVGW